jgi:hypothetical protein
MGCRGHASPNAIVFVILESALPREERELMIAAAASGCCPHAIKPGFLNPACFFPYLSGKPVNRRWIGTPYRHPKGTPLSGGFWR